MSILLYGGVILFLIGWIWNIVAAFKTGGTLWGVHNIFLQPLIGIISAILKKTHWAPVGFMILGLILFFISGGMVEINR
jgi:uncharacterized membrane protein YjfL (UPF0719 family)